MLIYFPLHLLWACLNIGLLYVLEILGKAMHLPSSQHDVRSFPIG